MKFNELFAPDLPDDSYYGVYVPFVWFDLERAAGAFHCEQCRALTRWRWFDTQDSYIIVCSTECLETLYENNQIPVCTEGDERIGSQYQTSLPSDIQIEAGGGPEQLRLQTPDGAGFVAGGNSGDYTEGAVNL